MCSTLPVWTTAGPSTARIFSPASRVRFMARAISRTVTPLGFSLETGLAMNSKRFWRAWVSAGKTRSPCRPTTIRSPLRTSVMGMQRAGAAFRIDEDSAVHFLVFDVDPLAADAHLSSVVGGAVELLGEGAVHVGLHGAAVGGGGRNGPMVVDAVEQFAQDFGAAGPDLDSGVAGVGLALADADVLDDVGAALGDDLVEDLGKKEGIDDVALDLDFLDKGVRCRRHAGSPER